MTRRSSNPLECFCSRTYTNAIDLEEHRRARGHFSSHICGKLCQHPPVVHHDISISKCGSCGKICERPDILKDHRIVTGHCSCSDCDLFFESKSALNVHRKEELHASEYRCCNCGISFKDIHALNTHVHRKISRKKTSKQVKRVTAASIGDRTCKVCQRTFLSLESLQQHQESIKHKPLSALSCPAGDGCKGKFSAPSALLHHLESGKCCSGMDRDDIYDIIRLYDKDRTIHNLPTLTPSSSIYLFSKNPTPCPETPKETVGSSSDSSLIIRAPFQGDVEGVLGDLLLLENSQVVDEVACGLRCPLCPKKRKPFATIQALQQHMDSPAHCDKIYHCPSDFFLGEVSKGKTNEGKRKDFTTLAGLVNHLESGACRGGKRTFLHCIEFIQQHLKQWGFREIRLLLPGSKD